MLCAQVLIEAAEQGAFSYKDSGISVMGRTSVLEHARA